MDENHPALVAARSSWRCVQAKDKEGWLALMADDVLFEDPIGVSPTNPSGEGIRGKSALSEFYDENMVPNSIRIETNESFVAGDESAHVLTLTTSFPNAMRMIVHGIFTYAVNEAGLLTNLRGYWTIQDSKFEKTEDPA